MSRCVIVGSGNNLVLSTAQPCDGFLLVEVQDAKDQLSYTDVSLIFGAAASLYGLVFVFKLALKQLGF